MEWMKNPKNFLVFLGCPGSGKTHFCCSIMNDMAANKSMIYRRMWDEPDFVMRVKKSFDMDGSFEAEVEYLTDDELVVFDDLGSTSISPWKIDVLFKFIDFRYKSGKPTVITSNFKEEEIREKLGFRIHSRLFDCANTLLNFSTVDWRRVPLDERP